MTAELPGTYISPEQLRIGLYIHLDLGWMEHPFTFSSFKIKDESQLAKVRSLGLKKIRYDQDRSDVAPAKVASAPAAVPAPPKKQAPPEPQQSIVAPDPQTRVARLKQLNEAILESERSFSRHAATVREAVPNLEDHPDRAKEVAGTIIKDLIGSIMTEQDVVLHAIGNRSRSTENHVHPLNVTILSLTLAKSLSIRDDEATVLGTAAMFHDVGKTSGLKGKSFIDIHCEVGASIAERAGLPERAAKVILQHHEYMDGSGFPKRLRGEQIDPLARLLGLVNHFDNLCNPPNPADALTPHEAVSTMYATQQHRFDPAMLQMMVRTFGVYPPGSVVQLSNGMYGIVLTSNPDKPLLPLVMLHMPKVARETPVVLELSREPNLSIKKCMRPEHLPAEAFQYLSPRKRISYYFLKEPLTGTATTASTDMSAPPPLQRQVG